MLLESYSCALPFPVPGSIPETTTACLLPCTIPADALGHCVRTRRRSPCGRVDAVVATAVRSIRCQAILSYGCMQCPVIVEVLCKCTPSGCASLQVVHDFSQSASLQVLVMYAYSTHSAICAWLSIPAPAAWHRCQNQSKAPENTAIMAEILAGPVPSQPMELNVDGRTAARAVKCKRAWFSKLVPDHAYIWSVPFAVAAYGYVGKEAVRFGMPWGTLLVKVGAIPGALGDAAAVGSGAEGDC